MTISTRFTQRLLVDRSLASLQSSLGRLARTQEQLRTGRIVNRSSDSPIGTNTAMRPRSETTAQTQDARDVEELKAVAYQASLATTARALQPSLIDFLR